MTRFLEASGLEHADLNLPNPSQSKRNGRIDIFHFSDINPLVSREGDPSRFTRRRVFRLEYARLAGVLEKNNEERERAMRAYPPDVREEVGRGRGGGCRGVGSAVREPRCRAGD